jgi:hypothetical protein
MYVRLFETRTEWGHQNSSQEDVFFGYAEDLGLDMNRFRAVYDDPSTLEKIHRDQEAGRALGVTGTPTFFFNGEQLVPPAPARSSTRVCHAWSSARPMRQSPELAATLGAAHGLRATDAVHLATAVSAGADRFITNNSSDFRRPSATPT